MNRFYHRVTGTWSPGETEHVRARPTIIVRFAAANARSNVSRNATCTSANERPAALCRHPTYALPLQEVANIASFMGGCNGVAALLGARENGWLTLPRFLAGPSAVPELPPTTNEQAEALRTTLAALRRANQRLSTQDAVTRALADSASLAAAAPKILQAICEHLRWSAGGLWYVDEPGGVLRSSAVWHLPTIEVPRFEAATREFTFAPVRACRVGSGQAARPLGSRTWSGMRTSRAVRLRTRRVYMGRLGFPSCSMEVCWA